MKVNTIPTTENTFGIGKLCYLRDNFEKYTFLNSHIYTDRKTEEPYLILILFSSLF